MTSAALRLAQPRAVPKFHVELHTGRLLELRIVTSIRTAADMEEFSDRIWEKLARAKDRVVICSDYRAVQMVLPPERAEEWADLMRATSHRVERSAILLDKDKATFNLQLQRSALRVGNRTRKLFFDEAAASAWIGPVLDHAERARAHRFYGGATLF
jgi:hypothetical protein